MKSDKLSLQSSPIPEFDEDVKIIEGKYYNKRYNFGFALPTTDWEISYDKSIDSLVIQDSSLSLIENLTLLASLNRRDMMDTLSVVQFGLVPLYEPRIVTSLAKQSLQETKQQFPAPDTVRVISEVTLTGMSKLRGAYYIVEFSEKSGLNYPVWINMFLVHDKMCYGIICQVKTDAYDFLINDLEDILKSFRIFGNSK